MHTIDATDQPVIAIWKSTSRETLTKSTSKMVDPPLGENESNNQRMEKVQKSKNNKNQDKNELEMAENGQENQDSNISLVKTILLIKKVWAGWEKLSNKDFIVDAIATAVAMINKWITLEAIEGVWDHKERKLIASEINQVKP